MISIIQVFLFFFSPFHGSMCFMFLIPGSRILVRSPTCTCSKFKMRRFDSYGPCWRFRDSGLKFRVLFNFKGKDLVLKDSRSMLKDSDPTFHVKGSRFRNSLASSMLEVLGATFQFEGKVLVPKDSSFHVRRFGSHDPFKRFLVKRSGSRSQVPY